MWKVIAKDRKGPMNLRADPLNPLGEPFSHLQLSLIGERRRSAQGSPHFSPTLLMLGDNKLARQKLTDLELLAPYLDYHLEGYKSPCRFDTEDTFVL
ncbi:hypothetical protein TNCV_2022591 [Trichonephila clavipes]|nr:hypothetical protein TNCV_2022591 [Trichonephila clavipes]